MAEQLYVPGIDANGDSRRVLIDVENGAVRVFGGLLSYIWAGAGIAGAPAATAMKDGTVGADSSGASTGLTYHVVSGAWVATGGTVLNLYGG